jgi:hypothetical protein
LDVAFPTRRRDTRAREQCARPARPERASSGGRFDHVPRARENGAHVRQASPARRADGTAPQPCRAPRALCVVVLINQVATRTKEVLGTSGLVPVLGEASAHIRNVQVCSAGRMPLLPPAQTGGYGLLEPLAHGTQQVHEQASSSSSAVENLQPQQLARSSVKIVLVGDGTELHCIRLY